MVKESKNDQFMFPSTGGKLRKQGFIPKSSKSYPNHSYINKLFDGFVKKNLQSIIDDIEKELNGAKETKDNAQKVLDTTMKASFKDDYCSSDDEDEFVDNLLKEYEKNKAEISQAYKKRKTEAVSPIFATKLKNINEKDMKKFGTLEIQFFKAIELDKFESNLKLEKSHKVVVQMKAIQSKYFKFLDAERKLLEEKEQFLKDWQERYNKIVSDKSAAEENEDLKLMNKNIDMYDTIIAGVQQEMKEEIEKEKELAKTKLQEMYAKFNKK
ncbi:predicted protein [Naegleria gruberi]|uniref:Predicted protein n=1 Tax=Naegleria gruberi TaxID=5762 RepID=D2VLS3_NAEGR|nr:uncharacterized protein NAEGRDRAFT_69882 [Naegleria gruberi]EFC42193.1 predicted protein [Naegleria gruberi]|eukprot:XP_002674937.1 predicted protein [Naegleria gruberi strain NEG-M]